MPELEELYSTKTITPQLLKEIQIVLKDKAYGSVEIYVENFRVTQITDRNIRKTNNNKLNYRGNKINWKYPRTSS